MASGGFRLPNDTQRSFICGMTGSGKTRAAAWQLSMRNLTGMPWVVFDFKHDELIEQIHYAREIGVTDKVPKAPGIYIVRPAPHELLECQAMLWSIWERGRTGVWVDEGYMLAGQDKKSAAFDAIMTQGRSKRIPAIVLAQRPAWLSKFILSESDFFQAFHLNVPADKERVRDFTTAQINDDLPRFWSHWYDVAERYYTVLKPVPDDEHILDTFDTRMRPRRRLL